MIKAVIGFTIAAVIFMGLAMYLESCPNVGPHTVHPVDRTLQVVDVFHDDARNVTCWVANDHGIFCMRDAEIKE